MVITQRYLEDGKRVAQMDSFTPWIDDLIQEAIDVIKNQSTKYDEFRFTVNGCEFVATKESSFEDLRNHYNEYLKGLK